MRLNRFVAAPLLSVALILAMPVAWAGQAAPMQPPAPAPAFDTQGFSFLMGTWHGSGRFAMNQQPVSSVMTFEQVNRTTVAVSGTEDAPNTYRYRALWSRERDTGQLVMLMSSSFDGPALFKSKGWVGNQLVFEPAAGVDTGASRVRFTYVRTGAGTFDLTYEFWAGTKWLVGDKQTFEKAR